MAPERLTGADFEKLICEQAEIYEKRGLACFGRYGVQASMRPKEGEIGIYEPMMIQSLPDFEGVGRGGLHIIFDAKVCSQASFPWAKYRSETRGARARQLKHMLRRARFGTKCFFLIHWNERQLAKKTVPAVTYLFPVQAGVLYWDRVESLEIRSLTQEDCFDWGTQVTWRASGRGKKLRPEFLSAMYYYHNYQSSPDEHASEMGLLE
jgi:penicillin-binding protein-related factor A (putative recombinase)